MPISIQCPHCSGTLKVRDESAAGKKVRCPKCEEPFVVEFPVEDDFTSDNPFGGADFDESGEPPEEEEEAPVRRRAAREEAPKKKKGKKKKGGDSLAWLMPAAVVVVVLALVGGLGTVAVMFGGSLLSLGGDGNKIDMTYLPPDAAGVIYLRVGDAWKSPLGQTFANLPQVKKEMGNLGTNELKPEDIISVTFCIPGNAAELQQQSPLWVMRSHKMFDASRGSGGVTYQKLDHQGTTYYRANEVGGSAGSVWQPRSTVAVYGTDADVKKAIERGAKKTRRPEFDFIDPSHHLVVAWINNPALMGSAAPSGMMPGMGDVDKLFKEKVRGLSMGMDLSDSVKVKAAVLCHPGGATEVKTAVDKSLADGKKSLADAKKSPFIFGDMKSALDIADQTVSTIQVSQNGDEVVMTGSVPSSVKPLIEKMAGQAGGPMGPGGMAPPQPPPGMPNPHGQGGMPSSHGQPPGMPMPMPTPMPMPMPNPHGQR